jgi:hypothetical protein
MPNVSSTSVTRLSLSGTTTIRRQDPTGQPRDDTLYTELQANALPGVKRSFDDKAAITSDNLLLLGVS